MMYFGEPWPSGVCDVGRQVTTPTGDPCFSCGEPIEVDQQGSFIYSQEGARPVHKECSLRDVVGGIGHIENHRYWCIGEHDPDGGRTRRQSSLEVWDWVQQHGVPHFS